MIEGTEFRGLAADGRDAMVDFARRLMQTPSLPGEEAAVAALVEEEMRHLGYDEVWRDGAGNVIGLVRATEPGRDRPPRRLMFNTHMDHVDVGDPERWPYPPYAATIADGAIWGRGASDLTGPLACQVHAIAALKRLGRPLPNDCYVSGVVQEEVGGLGAQELAQTVPTDYCILGEPSANALMHGHRGRVELRATFTGRSVHASVPGQGANPLYALGRFLQGVEGIPMVHDPENPGLGASTVAPTLLYTDQTSSNVTPAQVIQHLDWRNVPAEGVAAILEKVQAVAAASGVPGVTILVEPMPRALTSYTGVTRAIGAISPALGTAADHPLVIGAQAALEAALGHPVPVGLWPFATDGGHFVAAGTPCIGFSPGWIEVIHTVDERISIDLMVEAFAGYMALGYGLS
ncbi:MAG TPA: M20/M25/M40 family metallo-hydrolase [Chloroflexia bacterium]|nr:M20/M25/M40 family metallo-hydrolase [Chloroflexia bacterium]